MTLRISAAVRLALAAGLCLLSAAPARSQQAQTVQLDDNCTVSVLNRNVRVHSDGSWVLPNVPANFGLVRARATCVVDGETMSGESDPFVVPANGIVNLPKLTFTRSTPIPQALTVTASSGTIGTIGGTVQLTVIARFADGLQKDVTTSAAGTQYGASNPAIATVSADGLVSAVKAGLVLIQATNEGASGMTSIQVVLAGNDTDGDGMPDDYEIAHGFDPNNPIDGQEDPDRDGLTNAQEFLRGTDPRNADSDNDGLKDGQEIARGTNPLVADTDGDGIADGLEVAVGTDPLNGASFNLAASLSDLRVTPASFLLNFNTIEGEASTQLRAIGTLKDGRTLDVTARGVDFRTSDVTVCSFGAGEGRVFAGENGSCAITAAIGPFSATSTGTIRSFSPTALSFLNLPGSVNNVDVSGDFAYVAAGSAGLQVVDVSNRLNPRIVAALGLPGNANDVKLDGARAYIAGGSAGLHIVDVSNPASPQLVATVDTPGDASDVRPAGNLVFIADGSGGLRIADVTNPAQARIVGFLALPGFARGVYVSGPRAVVAAGNFLRVLDVSNPAAPTLLGSVSLPDDAKDVVIVGSFAYVADYTASLQVVDISNPAQPRVVGSTPGSLGGFLMDVTASPPFVFGADVFFVNGVPIVDTTLPNNPVPRAILDFSRFGFGFDDNGTGIAVDGTYIYLTAQSGITDNGTVDFRNRLYIGQYRAFEDNKGIAPTVAITAPADNATFIEGETVTVTATAVDDVAVASVSFLVNGQAVFTDTSAPYQYSFTAQQGVASLTITASALDLGSNVGSADVHVAVVPDPGTTVVGRVIGRDGLPFAGVTVIVLDKTSTTLTDGTFSIPSVSTLVPVITVNASLTVNGSILSGTSASLPPVRGGTTNVGDIIVAATAFDDDLGSLVDLCDFCSVTVPLPFSFPIGNRRFTEITIRNGSVSTDDGDEFEALCCNLRTIEGGGGEGGGELALRAALADAASDPTMGTFVNDTLPGRFVVTWNRLFTPDTGSQRSTAQMILFADGRVQFGYRGVAPGIFTEVGYFPSDSNRFRDVDFSASEGVTIGARDSVFEFFSPFDHPFDLDGGFVVFKPSGDGGYQTRPVPDVVPPVCTIVNPADGATLFQGEVLSVLVNATDNAGITHVTITDGSDVTADVALAPYSAPFTVPADATRATFTARAFDSWGNSSACTVTTTVTPGPPPTLTITAPAAGAVLTAGSTIPITIDAANRVPVESVALSVNGVALSTDGVSPFEFQFTVPADVASLSFSASATDTVGKNGTSASVSASVAPDPLTSVQGRTVDKLGAPIAGANLTLSLHGASVEVFNFDDPLASLPDLTGRTADRTLLVSTINQRNPDGIFGADPFDFGPAANHATRIRAALHTIGANSYTFTLGVNAGGRLLVNGATVIDIPTANGGYQEASGEVFVPPGDASIEILTFDNGRPEVRLTYAAPGDDEEKVPETAELTPPATPFHATSQGDGSFAIAGVPTILGDLIVRASAIVDGRTARGHSAPLTPVPGGATSAGDITVSAGGRIGYYDLDSNSGSPNQLPPIETAGLQGTDVGDLNTADLSRFDVLFVQNGDNGGYSGVYLDNLARINQWVADGGTLIFHDRHVESAATILPGSPGVFVRDFSDDANIDIVDDSTQVTHGPGGTITNASLDGGTSSSHGWIEAASIPAGARGILSQGDPAHLVLYTYTYGTGRIIYSTIPLDFYLDGAGPPAVVVTMRIYAANVVAFGNDPR